MKLTHACDEIGTPMCITVDFDTLDKQLVTIRNRDTMKQESMEINLVALGTLKMLLS